MNKSEAVAEDQIRASFEAALVSKWGWNIGRNDSGEYARKDVQGMWDIYRTAEMLAYERDDTTTALLHLLADIREACRDRGQRMQGELVRYIRELTNKAELWDEYQGKAPTTYLAGPAKVDMGGIVFNIPKGKVAELRGFDAPSRREDNPDE